MPLNELQIRNAKAKDKPMSFQTAAAFSLK